MPGSVTMEPATARTIDEPVMKVALAACSSQSPATPAKVGASLSTGADSQ
jgi:hypothetical protein